MLELYSSPTLSITQPPNKDFICCTWNGPQTEQTIRTGGWHIIDVVKKHGITKVLVDNTLVIGDWHQAADWVFNTWFPELMNQGVKRFARIRAGRLLPEATARRAVPDTHNIKSFNTPQEAIDWLSH